jgi:hypothetical protein
MSIASMTLEELQQLIDARIRAHLDELATPGATPLGKSQARR